MKPLRVLGFLLLLIGINANLAWFWHLYSGSDAAKIEACGGLALYATCVGGLLLLCAKIFDTDG